MAVQQRLQDNDHVGPDNPGRCLYDHGLVELIDGAVGAVPAVPLLAALPDQGPTPGWLIGVCAVPVLLKFARLSVMGVLPCCLLITITVSALSEERTAANDDRRSGFGTVAETLVPGYMLHDRLLRPAMVKVAVPVEKTAGAPEDNPRE